MGGMLFGTIFGVIIIPGLYYIFAKIADGRQLIKDEEDGSLTEELVHAIDTFPQTDENQDHA
jgi:HAE1 family hydrophobic/amphiphilic exporter-1